MKSQCVGRKCGQPIPRKSRQPNRGRNQVLPPSEKMDKQSCSKTVGSERGPKYQRKMNHNARCYDQNELRTNTSPQKRNTARHGTLRQKQTRTNTDKHGTESTNKNQTRSNTERIQNNKQNKLKRNTAALDANTAITYEQPAR